LAYQSSWLWRLLPPSPSLNPHLFLSFPFLFATFIQESLGEILHYMWNQLPSTWCMGRVYSHLQQWEEEVTLFHLLSPSEHWYCWNLFWKESHFQLFDFQSFSCAMHDLDNLFGFIEAYVECPVTMDRLLISTL
jgi:hypothetical protein